MLGIAGASIWPAYHLGLTATYSGRAHAFVQAEGFLYAFVAGFLLTAIPRFTGTAAPGRAAQLALAALLVLASASFELRSFVLGHLAFAAAHLMLIGLAARRFLQRKQQPPDTFALVGTGIACGAVAAFVNTGVALEAIDPRWDLLGRRLLTEGMVLLLVLGVGGFLGPRLLGFAQMPLVQVGAQGPRRRSGLYLAAGMALALTLVLEYGADIPWLAYLRAGIATAVLLVTITPWRPPAVRTTLSWCVWTGCWLVIAALWLSAIDPATAWSSCTSSSWGLHAPDPRRRHPVTLSHGGHGLEAEQRSWPLRIGMATGLVALVLRVGAGFAQDSFFEQLAWAAAFWIAGVAFWGMHVVRLILASACEAGSDRSSSHRPHQQLPRSFGAVARVRFPNGRCGRAAAQDEPLYRRLSDEDRRRLAEVSLVRSYSKGTTIFSEGDPSDFLFTVESGRLKVTKMLGGGKEVILEILGAGDPLGAVAAYEARPYPPRR